MKVTPKVLVEMAMSDVVNDRPGEAMIHLWALREMLNGVVITETPAIQPESLPPMQRLKERVMPREITCPTCKAKPNQGCFRLTSRGPNGKPTDQPLLAADGKPMLHKTRSKKAREVSA